MWTQAQDAALQHQDTWKRALDVLCALNSNKDCERPTCPTVSRPELPSTVSGEGCPTNAATTAATIVAEEPEATLPCALTQADLDMNQDKLTLTFSEAVKVLKLDVTQIVIQNAHTRDQEQSVQLTKTSTSASNDGTVIVVSLSKQDTNAIKAAASLASFSSANAYVSVTKTAIADMNVEAKTLRVTHFVKDTTKPKLLSFDLNMVTKKLELRFDETVDGRTFSGNMIEFVNSGMVSEATSKYKIWSNPSHTSRPTSKIVVDLTDDVNEIRSQNDDAQTTLCTGKADTYLILGGVVKDMRGNGCYWDQSATCTDVGQRDLARPVTVGNTAMQVTKFEGSKATLPCGSCTHVEYGTKYWNKEQENHEFKTLEESAETFPRNGKTCKFLKPMKSSKFGPTLMTSSMWRSSMEHEKEWKCMIPEVWNNKGGYAWRPCGVYKDSTYQDCTDVIT